jgi:hypothetical protein
MENIADLFVGDFGWTFGKRTLILHYKLMEYGGFDDHVAVYDSVSIYFNPGLPIRLHKWSCE